MTAGPVVGIIDYQSGNIRSVTNAVQFAGAQVRPVRTPGEIDACSHVILPGVGAFGFCAERLRSSRLLPVLEQWALVDRRPLLGVCVGMQLLADFSEEQGRHEGLGWIGGAVRRLKSTDAAIRVPHVGWNAVQFREEFGDFRVGEAPDFYFDHSYAYDSATDRAEIATTEHARRFSAIVRRENIVAVQFHPEKSQTAGLRLMKAFLAM